MSGVVFDRPFLTQPIFHYTLEVALVLQFYSLVYMSGCTAATPIVTSWTENENENDNNNKMKSTPKLC